MLAVVVPLLLAACILAADVIEGPKTAYIGVLAVVPMLAAVFGSPAQTALVAVTTWLAALAFGLVASDGGNAAQVVRLVIIAIVGVIAVLAARLRTVRDRQLLAAMHEAAVARDLLHIAETDELTGLLNRRGALERLAEDRASTWTLAIVDCDALKRVNDELGHRAGDEYLRAIAARFASSVSAWDVLARWGGDEFILALAVPVVDAHGVLERVRHAIARDVVTTTAGAVPASVSMGACAWHPGEELDAALQQADAALYRAKRAGGNQVVIA